MSLYIGNLSARTRSDDLERAFQRFGRCNVQLKKEGYGFVVFDFPHDAEKALTTLQGKNICGERLTLTWSNKQPRPFQKVARGARSYESQRGRNAVRGGDYAGRKKGSNGWRDYQMGSKQPDSGDGRLNSAGMLDEETGYHQDNIKDYIGVERHDFGEGLHGSVVPNLVDNDRWGEQVHDPSNDNVLENGMGFDRYEPYQGYDGKGEDENHRMGYSGSSPLPQSSQENVRREHIGDAALNRLNDSIARQMCYGCGGSGHKMRNCPKKHAYRRKYTKFDHRHDDGIDQSSRGGRELERFRSKSWGKLPSSRDTMSTRQQKNDGRASGSGKYQRLIKNGSSPLIKETDRDRRQDNGGNKRREIGTAKQSTAKKARRSLSSSLHSDYTAPRSSSISQSTKSVPTPRSSSNSRSSSKSHHSGSRSSKSRSRPGSPAPLSLSVSLGQPLQSSPNKVQLDLKGSLDNSTIPRTKDMVAEQGQPVEGDVQLENSKRGNTLMAVNNESILSTSKVVEDMEKDRSLERDDNDNRITSGSLYEVTNPSTPLPEKGGLSAGSSSPEILGDMLEFQNSGTLMMDHMPATIRKPDSVASSSSLSAHSTGISSEEMYMVLKHYGLELPEENERHLSVEAYFGSARLWPWEIIYYRRLRKGPISIENHARRVAQNQEFGIVDKYIRSSSGWGEMGQDNL